MNVHQIQLTLSDFAENYPVQLHYLLLGVTKLSIQKGQMFGRSI